MPNIKDIHIFTDGMNLDADPKFVKPSQTREAWNCRYDDTTNSRAGATTNFKGNVYIPNPYIDFDAAGGFVMGTCYDQKRSQLIYFANHTTEEGVVSGIYSVTEDDNVVRVILRDNYTPVYWFGDKLNFSHLHKITAIVIDDMLYWNDGYNPPRKINIVRAMASGGVGGYTDIDNAEFNAIKFPPLYPPTGFVYTDSSTVLNNVKGNTFLFKYRFIYDDFERSVCSPESKPIVSTKEYQYNGSILDTTTNNAISISLWSGTSSVAHIELMCRIGQSGDWFIVKTFNKSAEDIADRQYFNYVFRNDSSRIAVDQDFIARPFDYVPDLADSMEFIDNKYMAFGGITEGFDNIETDIQLTPFVDQLPLLDPNTGSSISTVGLIHKQYVSKIVFVGGYPCYRSGYLYTVDPAFLTLLSADDTYRVKAQRNITEVPSGPTTFGFEYSASDQVQNSYLLMSTFVDKIVDFINDTFSEVFATKYKSWGDSFGDLDENQFAILPNGWNSDGWAATINANSYIDFFNGAGQANRVMGGVKSGANHLFGLVYTMEDGKLTTVQGENQSVYIPFQTESPYKVFEESKGVLRHRIQWRINHLPPAGAVAYHWVYGGRTNIGEYRQYLIGGRKEDDAIFSDMAEDGIVYTYINLAFLNELTIDPTTLDVVNVQFPIYATSLTPYLFTKGDRIRFLTKWIDSADPVQANSQYPIGMYIGTADEKMLDMEILGYKQDENGDNTNVIKVQFFDYDHYLIGRGSLVEIYTPSDNSQEVVYREFGETYPIITVNGVNYHAGHKVNQSATTAAIGTFTTVDICHVLRAMPYKTNINGVEVGGEKNFWCESDSFSDFFPSEVRQFSRANYYDPNANRSYQYLIRRSNAYFEDTMSNGLSTFEFDKYTTLSSRHGRIYSMKELGYTLKVLQENKLTSIYIGRNGLKQASENGVDVVVATDNVFNVSNPSELEYGCRTPESVIAVDRTMYFYDKIRKCIVSDDANGPTSISDDSISSFIKEQDGSSVFVGYDPDYKEVYFAFSVSGTVVMYSHKYKNWKCFVDLVDPLGRGPEHFGRAGNTLYSFINGRMWRHNVDYDYTNDVDVPRNNFYGNQQTMALKFVSAHQSVVVFNSIAINSNKKWSSPEFTDITAPANSTCKLGQKSKIMPGAFVAKEGMWYAPYGRNALTRASAPNLYDLVNGTPLRADYIEQRIENSDTEEVVLHSVIVHCTHSPVSG